MKTDIISTKIADLLKMAGITDHQVMEELIDHYLTHIEAKIESGTNTQKAIRETYRDIANLDIDKFNTTKSNRNRLGLLMFFLLFIGMGFYFFPCHLQANKNELCPNEEIEIPTVQLPNGFPIAMNQLIITSEYGVRMHPIKKKSELHKGIDIRARMGTPVIATGDGIVKEAGFSKLAGNYIIIEHEGGFKTKYYHLLDIAIEEKTAVKSGQVIGKVGNSGQSIMPHLHYEILKDDLHMNPRQIMNP